MIFNAVRRQPERSTRIAVCCGPSGSPLRVEKSSRRPETAAQFVPDIERKMGSEKRPTTAAAAAGAPYLPAELIPGIARHLTSLQDFFALRAACRAYRTALPASRAVLAAQPPHLLVPHHQSPSLALLHLPRRRLLRS